MNGDITMINKVGKFALLSAFFLLSYTATAEMTITEKGDVVIGSSDSASDLTVYGQIKNQNGGVIPKNVIVMWYGEKSNIPKGWAICDGKKGTPNLINMFVVGAGDLYSFKTTGGNSSVTLTVDEMPSHTHTMNNAGKHSHDLSLPPRGDKEWGSGSGNTMWGSWSQRQTTEDGQHKHTINSKGDGKPHDNMPPYYALYFIMKL